MNEYIVKKTEIIETEYLVRATNAINAEARIREKNGDYGSVVCIINEDKRERFMTRESK